MKNRIHSLFCVLMILLFSACGDGRERVEDYRNYLIESGEVAYKAEIRLHLEETIQTYTLYVTHGEEKTELRVMEPEAMAGLAAVVEGEDMTLTYDDVVFAGEKIDEGLPSPLLCFPLFWKGVQTGMLDVVTETAEGMEAELTCYEGEQAYLFRVLFPADSGLFRRAEVIRNGKIIAEIAVNEFDLPQRVVFES